MNKTTRAYSHADLLHWHLVNRGSACPPALLTYSTQADTLNGCCADHKQHGDQRDRWLKEVRGGLSTVTHTYMRTFTQTGYHTGCVQTCSLKFPWLNLSHALSFLFHELPCERPPINNNQLTEVFMQTTAGCCVYLSCGSTFWLKLGQVMPHWWIPAGHSDGFLVFK